MKKLVAWLLTAILLTGSCFAVGADAEAGAPDAALSEEARIEALIEAQAPAIALNEQIVAEVEADAVLSETYAGSYLNDENELVVLMTDTSIATTAKLYQSADAPAFEVEQATYSLQYLQALMDSTTQKILDAAGDAPVPDDSFLRNIVALHIDISENSLVVSLLDNSEENIEEFKSMICDNTAIQFEKGSHMKRCASTATLTGYLGTVCYVKVSNGNKTDISIGSIGFRARRITSSGYIDGFVTAGHVVCNNGYKASVGSAVYADEQCETKIGTLQDYEVVNGDCAFVQVTANFLLQNKPENHPDVKLSSNYIIDNLPIGSIIQCYGALTKNYSAQLETPKEYIFDFNADGVWDYITVCTAKTTDKKPVGGDSGGICWFDSGVVGTLTGIKDDTNNIYIAPAVLSCNELGCFVY